MELDSTPEITAASICDRLGRRAIADRVGVGVTAVSNAAVDGRFPASWFAVIAAMCSEIGMPIPLTLFRWKAAEGVEDEKGAA